jgi:hypothetical protein
MADTDDRERSEQEEEAGELPVRPALDSRKPYEAPRIMKKRSVNRATLFTSGTVTSTGLTTMG